MPANYTQAWLEDPSSIRGLLVEVTAAIYNSSTSTWVDTVIYLSNIGYITEDSLTSYLPYLTGSLQTTESLSLDGSLSMSFGDIEVSNSVGDLDTWLDSTKYIWVNRPIQVYLGDPTWKLQSLSSVRDTANGGFQLVFNGIVQDIDSKDRSTLNIKVRDKLEKLNGPISDNKLGTNGIWGQGQTNQDTMRPLIFGEVFNVSPLLVNPSQLEYMYHDTNVGVIITATSAATNSLTCASTNGFVVDKVVIFTGTMFGGIVANQTYFVKSINANGTDFTVSLTSGGTTVALTTATSVTTSIMQAEVRVSSTETLLEVRDNGMPVYTDPSIFTNSSITRPSNLIVDLDNGKFKLTKPQFGTITASVQGAKRSVSFSGNGSLLEGTYTNNIANIIALIITQYGTASTRLNFSDIDLLNFSNFATNNVAPVGIAVTDRANILEVCTQLAMSANARLFMNRIGQLQLIQLGTTTLDSIVEITDNHILHNSLQISQKTAVIAATKIGYCKNYTTQTTLVTSLPTTHIDLYKEPWMSNTVTDTTVQKNYKLDSLPVQTDTNLIKGTDAAALAKSLNDYWKVPKIVYSFTGTSKLLSLKLGQAVTLAHSRFGLISTNVVTGLPVGKAGQVISISPNWMAGTVNIEVII